MALEHARILVTGVTGQVALPLALALAEEHDVWGTARFRDGVARARLEARSVTCVPVDLGDPDFGAVPGDLDYVLHFAVVHRGPDDFERDLAANVEGLGLLMHHCREARAFLHCSSTAVYAPAGHRRLKETDPLGDNHRVLMPTYSICKIAAEAMARYGARQWGLPTTIARLNVPYGDNGGWPAFHLEMMAAGQTVPVHADAPSLYNPIHEDDIAAQVPRLLDLAAVPAVTLNWAGRDQVSIEEWCAYLGELTGLEPRLEPTEHTLESVTTDNTRMHELVGETAVDWRDGLRRMVAARRPDLLAPGS